MRGDLKYPKHGWRFGKHIQLMCFSARYNAVNVIKLVMFTVCSEYNHVRSWSVTRFRGMISTQPGSMPVASFKVASIEDIEPHMNYHAGNDIGISVCVCVCACLCVCEKDLITDSQLDDVVFGELILILLWCLGPYGEKDDQQLFIQKIVPETDQLFVRLSSNGQRYSIMYNEVNNYFQTEMIIWITRWLIFYYLFLWQQTIYENKVHNNVE